MSILDKISSLFKNSLQKPIPNHETKITENAQGVFEFLDRSVAAFDNLFQSYNHRIENGTTNIFLLARKESYKEAIRHICKKCESKEAAIYSSLPEIFEILDMDEGEKNPQFPIFLNIYTMGHTKINIFLEILITDFALIPIQKFSIEELRSIYKNSHEWLQKICTWTEDALQKIVDFNTATHKSTQWLEALFEVLKKQDNLLEQLQKKIKTFQKLVEDAKIKSKKRDQLLKQFARPMEEIC